MYIIIIGAGSTGRPLIEMAIEDRNDVVVIEQDNERADRIAHDYDCLVLNDDAKDKQTLIDAEADRADALISTTEQDATNIMVCLLAEELDIPAIVSVVHNPEHMGIFRKIGVNTMGNPQHLIAEYLYRAVKQPSIVDFMRIGEGASVFETTVDEDAPIAGKTLQEAVSEGLVTEDILIIAIERNGEDLITPSGSTQILPNDLLTVYSEAGATPEITDIFGHYEDHETV